ncbi:dendritic cell-specific transmembrane protein [Antechinus flavipes]|uniref:dendritic cell-specific transmembrane protein n=1 Tax=Antechinus flavipes TaxID=38775 RepID=UPI0022365E96|nr:dendritic cell-specific transmembrane protein [Antechinus flavipes]
MNVGASAIGVFLCLWKFYLSPRNTGWKSFSQHFGVCCVVGFLSTMFLYLGLYWFLSSSIIFFLPFWIVMTILLCWSKHVRCFAILFFLSCGLHEGRNALIAAGTGIVTFGHVKNIFHNLKGLLEGIMCNLSFKSFAIHFPLLNKYIEAIQWLYSLVTDIGLFEEIVSLNHTLAMSILSPSKAFEIRLNDTKGEILSVIDHVTTVTEVVSSLGQGLLTITGFALVLFTTRRFMKRFLGPHSHKFENIYITRHFVQFDESERHQKRPCVLPLNKQERKKYIIIPSICLASKERRSLGLFFLPILTNLYVWAMFAALDYGLYHLISSINRHLQNLPGMEVHLKLYNEVKGNHDIINDSSFNISLFEPNCIPKPELFMSKTWIPLSVIILMLVILGLLSSILMQFKILVAGSFYPDVERDRIQYLHAKILRRRSKQSLRKGEKKLKQFITELHFWFPILKMFGEGTISSANENNP